MVGIGGEDRGPMICGLVAAVPSCSLAQPRTARANHYCEDARAAPGVATCSALLVIAGVQKQAGQLDLRLDAVWKSLQRAAKNMLGVADESPRTRARPQRRPWFRNYRRSYFRDCNNARRPTSSSPRSSAATALRARCLAISSAGSTALLDSIQSVAKHATETLDGNRRRLERSRRGELGKSLRSIVSGSVCCSNVS